MYIPPWLLSGKKEALNSFDFDGVSSTGLFKLNPIKDIIVTGRCYDEQHIVVEALAKLGYHNMTIHFNPIPLVIRGNHTPEARHISGMHKVNTLLSLQDKYNVTHWEDDPLQIALIKKYCKDVTVIEVPQTVEL